MSGMLPTQFLLVAPSTTGSVSLSIPSPADTAMSRFLEVAPNPDWPASVRRTLMRQPDDYFRPHFEGRVPTPEERAACIEVGVRCLTPVRVFENSLYRVEVYATPASGDSFVHLGITRHDGKTCKEWRHLQRIKNEIVGPEYEAMEMFPAESRLVDTGNQYHLWVHKDPAFRFPVGWTMRLISERPLGLEPSPGWQSAETPHSKEIPGFRECAPGAEAISGRRTMDSNAPLMGV